jgi:hypothetical protein
MDNKFLDSRKWEKTTDPISDPTVGDSKLHITARMNEMKSYEATKRDQDDGKATIKNLKTASQIYNKMTQ